MMRIFKKTYWLFLGILTRFSPKASTSLRYLLSKRSRLNWTRPQSLDEKISWLKVYVYNSSPLVAQCADKLRVRAYVSDLGFPELLNPLHSVFESVDDIDWNKLPSQFALKWSSGSGDNVICEDRNTLDVAESRKRLSDTRSDRSNWGSAELQYKSSPNLLLCEAYIAAPDSLGLIDYKFYCYEGEPKYVLAIQGRGTGHANYYLYDMEWNRVQGLLKSEGGEQGLSRPEGLEEAATFARALSAPFPFVRVDLYIIQGRTIFGELTFTPAGGVSASMTKEGDRVLGEPLKWLFSPRGEDYVKKVQ